MNAAPLKRVFNYPAAIEDPHFRVHMRLIPRRARQIEPALPFGRLWYVEAMATTI
jgi:hypothetical protein